MSRGKRGKGPKPKPAAHAARRRGAKATAGSTWGREWDCGQRARTAAAGSGKRPDVCGARQVPAGVLPQPDGYKLRAAVTRKIRAGARRGARAAGGRQQQGPRSNKEGKGKGGQDKRREPREASTRRPAGYHEYSLKRVFARAGFADGGRGGRGVDCAVHRDLDCRNMVMGENRRRRKPQEARSVVGGEVYPDYPAIKASPSMWHSAFLGAVDWSHQA